MDKKKSYMDTVHTEGRIWICAALVLLLLVPVAICLYYSAWPPASALFKGLLGVLPIFWTIGAIEAITYVPMLGAAGSYLGFVTGNLSNLKVPCALNAMDMADAKPGTEEGELVSTISIAVSSIVTLFVITLGVFVLGAIQPILDSPTLAPAFDNVLPALFGGLAVVFISKNWKIAIAPLVFMLVLFLLQPGLANSVSLLVPVGAIVAIVVARILYKRKLV